MLGATIRWSSFALILADAVFLLSPAQGQDKFYPRDGEPAPLLPWKQEKLSGTEGSTATELQNGKISPVGDAKAKEIIAKSARYFAYRLTDSQFHKSTTSPTMIDLVTGQQGPTKDLLLGHFRARPPRPLNQNQQDYLKEFSAQLIKALQDVLKGYPEPIVRVNAARMLIMVAETGTEEVADTFLELLRSTRESDAVKLWAARGLGELFRQGKPNASIFKDAKREAASILALQAFVARTPTLPADPEELEALRYIRRPAIQALGLTRHAVVPGDKTPAGRTAWWLLKVARKDGLTPPPGLPERVEAAIGVCQLQNGANKNVQLDYIAANVAPVVVDFIGEYNQAKGGNSEVALPWKVTAARLVQALDELKSQAQNSPAKTAKYVNDLVDKCKEALRPFELKDPNPNPAALDNWLRNNTPPSTSVYKDVAESKVKEPAE